MIYFGCVQAGIRLRISSTVTHIRTGSTQKHFTFTCVIHLRDVPDECMISPGAHLSLCASVFFKRLRENEQLRED